MDFEATLGSATRLNWISSFVTSKRPQMGTSPKPSCAGTQTIAKTMLDNLFNLRLFRDTEDFLCEEDKKRLSHLISYIAGLSNNPKSYIDSNYSTIIDFYAILFIPLYSIMVNHFSQLRDGNDFDNYDGLSLEEEEDYPID